MIDFAALVLGPAMDAFAGPTMLTPVRSKPGVPAYPARGVYASKPVEIQLPETDTFQQGFQSELGIRLSDYPVQPKQGDRLAMQQGTFEIGNIVFDGQGGATLILQRL